MPSINTDAASLAYEAATNTAWDNYLTATDAVVEKYAIENPNASDVEIWGLFDSLDGAATAARNAAVLAAQNAYRATTRPGGPLGRGLI